MSERRHMERKYLVIYSRVFDRKSGRVLGYLSDLTLEGAMIIGEEPLEKGLHLTLRMDLPDVAAFNQRHFDIEAEAMWSKPDVDPSFYNTGFQFLHPTDEHRAVLKHMIEMYEFKRNTSQYPPSVSEMQGDL